MRVRELIGLRDVITCFLAALAITLVVCGVPYLAAGGPVPSLSLTAATSAQKPITVQKMQPYRAPAHVAAPRLVTVATPAWPRAYHVLPGQSLSAIAASMYHSASDWPLIYWANKSEISYASLIYPGQNLVIPAPTSRVPAPPAVLAPAPPRPVQTADVQSYPQVQPKTVEQAAPVRQNASSSTGYSVGSSFQACVIRAESGGSAQIWNASGHYGLYQFSAATWAAYGGSPGLFGHASAAYQTQIFDNAMATAGGASNWSPYDGC